MMSGTISVENLDTLKVNVLRPREDILKDNSKTRHLAVRVMRTLLNMIKKNLEMFVSWQLVNLAR